MHYFFVLKIENLGNFILKILGILLGQSQSDVVVPHLF